MAQKSEKLKPVNCEWFLLMPQSHLPLLIAAHHLTKTMQNQNDKYADFVDHPRYGKRPRITGLNPDSKTGSKAWLHWHSPRDCRISNNAIFADRKRQNSGLGHVTHYFDVIRECRDCGRNFIFFALEQQHWYEVLRFNLSANCRECVECRKSRQLIARTRKRYDYLFSLPSRTDRETLELINCGITLVEQRVFGTKIAARLKQFLNEIPDDAKIRKHATYRDLVERSKKLLASEV